MKQFLFVTVVVFLFVTFAFAEKIDSYPYRKVVEASRREVVLLLGGVKGKRSLDEKVIYLARELANRPYVANPTGEGDWQPNALSYQGGAKHLDVKPLYRLDEFDCQSFVETMLAFMHATTLKEFDHNLVRNAYGALGNKNGIVRFANRNHFADADFNRVNEEEGRLTDVTKQMPLVKAADETTAWVNREQFLHRYYAQIFPAARKLPKKVSLTYLSKNKLVIQSADGSYLPNQALLDQIPTPAVIEMVYDTNRWTIAGRSIQSLIGSQENVSHLGVLYRQNFRKGEVIFQQINCAAANGTIICKKQPRTCDAPICHELMLVHATKAYPANYAFLNRVERLPLFNYLTSYQYHTYWYMRYPTLLGVHIEKIN